MTEHYLKLLNKSIIENPEKPLTQYGYYLLSGGFDCTLKLWDFDFIKDENSVISKPNFEYPGHSNWLFIFIFSSLKKK